MKLDGLILVLVAAHLVQCFDHSTNFDEQNLPAGGRNALAARGKSRIAECEQASMAQSEKESDHATTDDNRALKRLKTQDQLPVSLLSGFLGSGKTTLLKHILETKHSKNAAFKCAVIVNDMAELNIDKHLIDKSSLIQSDEVIAMQNGCVCCTLKNDLVDQVIDLVEKQKFDYMIIEASGVSEPFEIARLFAECDDDHDHEKEHKKPSLRSGKA